MSADDPADRLVRNQAVFREVNERVREVTLHFEPDGEATDFLCECTDPACVRLVSLTLEEYERLRGDSRRFAVAAQDGHVAPADERVVERHERYWVVEKLADTPLPRDGDRSAVDAR